MKKQIYRDSGLGDPEESLLFAQQNQLQLKTAIKLKACFNGTAINREWGTYNVRFTLQNGSEVQFSGFNVGYKGSGPQALIKALQLIKWSINKEVIYINESLEITREISNTKPKKKKQDEKNGKESQDEES